MKVKACPKCSKYNLKSATYCTDCLENLSNVTPMDTVQQEKVLKEYYYKQAFKSQHYKNRKINERKKPITRPTDLIFPIIWTILLPIFFLWLDYPAFEEEWWILVIIFAIAIFLPGLQWYKLIKNTKVMNRGSAIAIATIKNKEKRVAHFNGGEYGGGTVTTYYVYIKFNLIQAEHHTGHITISAQLKKGFWERLDKGHKINVRYAIEDPLILSIEGE